MTDASKQELIDKFKLGLTVEEIAEEYGVSPVTVYNQCNVWGLNEMAGVKSATFEPSWDIKGDHVQDWDLRMLRYAYREDRGFRVAHPYSEYLTKWREGLGDQVVTYDRETGFSRQPRQEGDEKYWRP